MRAEFENAGINSVGNKVMAWPAPRTKARFKIAVVNSQRAKVTAWQPRLRDEFNY